MSVIDKTTMHLKFPQDFFKNYARGKPCQVRIARECGHECNHAEGATVLAHISMPGLKAMGKKLVPDLCAAWACDTCHALLDRRLQPTQDAPVFHGWPKEHYSGWLSLMHLEGVMRTLNELVTAGVLPNPIKD